MMSVAMKVLEKAVAAKDYNLLVQKLVAKLREVGWTDDDIVQAAEKLAAAARRG